MRSIKSIVWLVCLILVSSVVFAQGKGINEPGTGIENPEIKEAGQGTGQGLDEGEFQEQKDSATGPQIQNQGESQQIQDKEQVQAQVNDIKQQLQQKQQQMNKEAEDVGGKKSEILKNQNRVRIAAQTLSQMANMMGGIGKEVSEIAKNFNNSVEATVRAEEKIQTRSGFARFFVGGDEEAAEELDQEVQQNQQRIQELKQLREQCECDEEVKEMMQEQIQQMEQEQTRLQQLAQAEKKSKGLFGWILK